MSREPRPLTVLMADDDEDDRLLARDAFEETDPGIDLRFVEDGEDLMAYLHGQGPFKDSPTPSLILLDLNMPRKDGREALVAIKADPLLRRIPVIILSTSQSEDDVVQSYELGVSSFVSKPGSYESLLELTRSLSRYWFHTVRLPASPAAG